MSIFGEVPAAVPVSIFQLSLEYKNDPRDEKVNLAISAYRTDEGLPWVLPVVRAIEAVMAADSTLNHEYLPIELQKWLNPEIFLEKKWSNFHESKKFSHFLYIARDL